MYVCGMTVYIIVILVMRVMVVFDMAYRWLGLWL